MRFTKMEGLGNDYVYLDCFHGAPDDLPRLARTMSDRHFGVGGDGLICLFPSAVADFRMAMFNADGSQGEMCGNGIRCAAKLAYDSGRVARKELRVETLAGVKAVTLTENHGEVTGAVVDMGIPCVGEKHQISAGGERFEVTAVSMGNPHGVVICGDVKGIDITAVGAVLGRASCFPAGANIEFVEIAAPDRLIMRVWERGSGETLACGTGACAALAAAHTQGLVRREATVTLPGGNLLLRWAENGSLYMTGPARTVFRGEWPD